MDAWVQQAIKTLPSIFQNERFVDFLGLDIHFCDNIEWFTQMEGFVETSLINWNSRFFSFHSLSKTKKNSNNSKTLLSTRTTECYLRNDSTTWISLRMLPHSHSFSRWLHWPPIFCRSKHKLHQSNALIWRNFFRWGHFGPRLQNKYCHTQTTNAIWSSSLCGWWIFQRKGKKKKCVVSKNENFATKKKFQNRIESRTFAYTIHLATSTTSLRRTSSRNTFKRFIPMQTRKRSLTSEPEHVTPHSYMLNSFLTPRLSELIKVVLLSDFVGIGIQSER